MNKQLSSFHHITVRKEHVCERCRSRIRQGALAVTTTDWLSGIPRRRYYHIGCYWKRNPDDPGEAALEPFEEPDEGDPFIFLEPFEAEKRKKMKKNPKGGELIGTILFGLFMLAGLWYLNTRVEGAGDRRSGQPRTEEERMERHEEQYGSTELPPRGSGLS